MGRSTRGPRTGSPIQLGLIPFSSLSRGVLCSRAGGRFLRDERRVDESVETKSSRYPSASSGVQNTLCDLLN